MAFIDSLLKTREFLKTANRARPSDLRYFAVFKNSLALVYP